MAALATLVVQNSALALVMEYSRKTGDTQLYIPSTAVVMAEICKLIVAVAAQYKVGSELCIPRRKRLALRGIGR